MENKNLIFLSGEIPKDLANRNKGLPKTVSIKVFGSYQTGIISWHSLKHIYAYEYKAGKIKLAREAALNSMRGRGEKELKYATLSEGYNGLFNIEEAISREYPESESYVLPTTGERFKLITQKGSFESWERDEWTTLEMEVRGLAYKLE